MDMVLRLCLVCKCRKAAIEFGGIKRKACLQCDAGLSKRKCVACGKTKLLSEFYRKSNIYTSYIKECKLCYNALQNVERAASDERGVARGVEVRASEIVEHATVGDS